MQINSNLKNLKSFCRKIGARILAQSNASFFPQNDFKFFKFEFTAIFIFIRLKIIFIKIIDIGLYILKSFQSGLI